MGFALPSMWQGKRPVSLPRHECDMQVCKCSIEQQCHRYTKYVLSCANRRVCFHPLSVCATVSYA